MAKRVLIGGLFHETHTFIATRTAEAEFQSGLGKWQVGEEILTKNQGDASCMGGLLDVATRHGWDLVPSVYFAASPGGMVAQSVVDSWLARFMADLDRELAADAPGLDGIYLVLHGAMVSDDMQDVEGAVLKLIAERCEAAGQAPPLCGVLDLHASLSPDMCAYSDCLRAYRENPHTDSKESAAHSAEFLQRLMTEPGLSTTTYYLYPGLLFSPQGTATASDPMRAVLARIREMEAEHPGIVCANAIAGYAYADTPFTGFSLSLVATDPELDGDALLAELAAIAYEHRELGHPQDADVDETFATISADDAGPIVLAEPSDNIGGGTPGDGTGLLQAMLDSGLPRCVCMIADPAAAAACHAAGVGATLDLEIGGHTDAFHGAPVPLTVTVTHLSDGTFDLEDPHSHLASMVGIHVDMGPSATVTAGNVTILLNTYKTPPFDLNQLRTQGIEPTEALVIGVKSAVAYRQAYRPIAAREVSVDTPGLGTGNLPTLPYQNVPRPIFPLDEV